jgi:hypothetical protein
MSTKIDVVKFTFKQAWRALDDALNSKNPYDSEEFSAAGDLVSYLSTQTACLIFASLNTKEDLVQLATFAKIVKKGAKDTITKIVVVNFSGNKQFEKAISKLGILDVVDPSINTKALRFKIDFYMKSLHGQIKSSGNNTAMNVKSMEQGSKGSETKRTDAANWLPPLECEDDIWLLKKESDCKKVLGRWLVRFMGPGPAVAQWVEIKGKTNAWKFEFKGDGKELFSSGSGTWYFQGDQKPEFVWKENSWLVTGSSFELFYHVDGAKQSRAKLKDKVLEIAKNSEYAQTKESAIVESFNKELVFKKEAEKLDGKAEIEGENGTDWLSNLEGKGSTDHLNTDPLEGKNDSSGDQINTDPMSGDVKSGDNNLGDGKMSGKGGAAGDLGGHYDGESSTDKLNRKGMEGPAGEKNKDGELLSNENKTNAHQSKYKGHNEAEQFDAQDGLLSNAATKHRDGAELGMKNTNNEHKTHYKGHNEAEAFDAQEAHNNQYKEDDLGGQNGGKSKTDHIPKFYNKDGSKPNRELNPQERAESDAYEGKSKTDKIPTHYGKGQDKSTPVDADADKKDRNRSEGFAKSKKSNEPDFDDEIGSDPYGGKSHTDKLKSHYGSKGTASEFEDISEDESSTPSREKKKRDLNGKSTTDQIESHMGGGKKLAQDSEDDLFEDESRESDQISGKRGTDKGEESSSKNKKIDKTDKAEKESKFDDDDLYAKKDKSGRKNGAVEKEENFYEENAKKKKEKIARTIEEKKEIEVELKQESIEEDFLNGDERGSKSRNKNSSSVEKDNEDEDDFQEESEGADVISIKDARASKLKQKPLVPEKEIDTDLKTMMAEANVTAVVAQNEIEIKCILDDFFEKTLIFICSEHGLNAAEPVKLNMTFKYMQKNTVLKMDATLISIDVIDVGVNYLTLELAENNAQSFSAFMKLYQQRQDNIEAFLKRAKGL